MLFSKKYTIVSLLGSVVILGAAFIAQETCDLSAEGLCWRFWSDIAAIGRITLMYGILFIPALLALPSPPSVFEAWKRFAVWAVPVLFALFLLTMFVDEGNSYYSFGFTGFALVVLYALYLLSSLGIIAVAVYRSFRK